MKKNKYKPGQTAPFIAQELQIESQLTKTAKRLQGGRKDKAYEYGVTLLCADGHCENMVIIAKNEEDASENAVKRFADVEVVDVYRVPENRKPHEIDRRPAKGVAGPER